MSESVEQKKTWLDEAMCDATSPNIVIPEIIDKKKQHVTKIVTCDEKRHINSLLGDNSSALPRRVASLTGPELVALRSEWAAGAMTVQQMCDMWGVSRVELMRESVKWGQRAVRDEYRARLAEGLIDEEAAIGKVANEGFDTLPRDSSAAVDRAVARAVDVVRHHKSDVAEARAMAMSVLRQADDGDLTLPQRATVLDKAVSALAKAITLERQAYGIVDDPAGNTDAVVPLEERLRAYTKSGGILTPPAAGKAA
jgi:hypothetical protein